MPTELLVATEPLSKPEVATAGRFFTVSEHARSLGVSPHAPLWAAIHALPSAPFAIASLGRAFHVAHFVVRQVAGPA